MIAMIIITAILIAVVVWFLIKRPTVPKLIVGQEDFGGEILPAEDYTEPRYVYADGSESFLVKFDMPIVGYRISKTLVIGIGYELMISAADIEAYVNDRNLKVIDADDLATIEANLKTLNAMRELIEDTIIPPYPVWVKSGKNFALYDGTRFFEPFKGTGNIIVKL
ncbi:MAG: hypothetical protein J5895_02265 [Alphaproteobacteria bacterium]|nr:hypothetical protein [Alphaproteobacteria bacterium]